MPGDRDEGSVRGRVVIAIALAALTLGCSRDRDARAPGRSPEIPSGLHIAVEVDGKEAAAIDAARLRAAAPDYAKGERRAWRLESLLGGPYARPDSVLEIESRGGVKTVYPRPAEKVEGREPALVQNRRGEILLALVRPEDPFPEFHGRGGNRGREGDPVRRIHDVVRLRLYVPGSGPDRAEKRPLLDASAVSVAVTIDGRPAAAWTAAELAKVSVVEIEGEGGDGKRQAWPLRGAVEILVGSGASIAKLIGAGGRGVSLSPADWNDGSRIPVLRINRRGQVKFQWVSTALEPLSVGALAEVSALEVLSGR